MCFFEQIYFQTFATSFIFQIVCSIYVSSVIYQITPTLLDSTFKFDYFCSHLCTFKYSILYRTCFVKLPLIRKYRIYSGFNSNMEKNHFIFSKNGKSGKKFLLHCHKCKFPTLRPVRCLSLSKLTYSKLNLKLKFSKLTWSRN